MRLKHLVVLLLMQSSFAEERKPATLSDLVTDCPKVELYQNPVDEGIVAAYCERDPGWWGKMIVCHHSEGKIDWAFKFPQEYEEWHGHYVVRCQWITLDQIESPVLELIESTHRGNGSIFLFELQGRELRQLLRTEVRGQLFDHLDAFNVPPGGTASFKGKHLEVNYVATEGKKSHEVVLIGILEIADVAGQSKPSKAYEQRCRWDSEKRIFVPAVPTSP